MIEQFKIESESAMHFADAEVKLKSFVRETRDTLNDLGEDFQDPFEALDFATAKFKKFEIELARINKELAERKARITGLAQERDSLKKDLTNLNEVNNNLRSELQDSKGGIVKNPEGFYQLCVSLGLISSEVSKSTARKHIEIIVSTENGRKSSASWIRSNATESGRIRKQS